MQVQFQFNVGDLVTHNVLKSITGIVEGLYVSKTGNLVNVLLSTGDTKYFDENELLKN